MWRFDIVANAHNSIDVDKFDYIARDCLNIGIKSSYDFKRLMKYSKVIDDHICFSSKEVYTVYELFHTRYSLFKQVYSHRVAKAIEYMIQDAFSLADPVLQISSRILEPETFAIHSFIHPSIHPSTHSLIHSSSILYFVSFSRFYLLTDGILKEIEVSRDPVCFLLFLSFLPPLV